MKFQINQQILLVFIIVCVTACNSKPDASATSAPAEQKYSGPTNKDVYEAINANNWGKLDSLIAKDAVDHGPMGTGPIKGLDSIKAMLKEFKAGFPDLKMEAMDEAIAGDMIFTRYHWTGTNSGSMNGMPGTNKKIEITGVDLARTKDGKLVEHWDYSDNLELYKQLGR